MLIYYSIVTGDELLPAWRRWQLETSFRSCRTYNPDVSILLAAYDRVDPDVQTLCDRYAVQLLPAGRYEDHLAAISNSRSSILALYPVLQKWLSLRLDQIESERILYVDSDTIFLGPIDSLSEACRADGLWAREEYMSRRSPSGYDPDHVSEELLQFLTRSLDIAYVPPFNSGVMLLDSETASEIGRHLDVLLDLVWRLLLSLLASGTAANAEPFDAISRTLECMESRRVDVRDALPVYPSGNRWIVEEMAAWLTLGKLGLSHHQIEPALAPLGDEFLTCDPRHNSALIVHYFSRFTEAAKEWVEQRFGWREWEDSSPPRSEEESKTKCRVALDAYFHTSSTFSRDEIAQLIEQAEALPTEPATVMGGDHSAVEPAYRSSTVRWITRGQRFDWIYDRLNELCRRVNEETWGFEITGLTERLQYTVYNASSRDFYGYHMDCGEDANQRKISIVVQLSDEADYDGGELRFFISHSEEIAPKALGTLVAFPAFLLHRVTPVTHGTRRCLVAWCSGPPFR